ncbi:MAG: hypothetical protein FJ271_19010 [Planctomycetes bacterium]|nr:hypothetical protein [Planctomycetota bacterium]
MTDPDGDRLRARVRVMQVICIALVLGVVFFLALAGYLVLSRGQGLNPPAGMPFLSMLALVMLLMNGPLALILPAAMTKNAIQRLASRTSSSTQDDEAQLLAVRQTSLIVGLALWEGVAFMAAIAFLLEGDPLVLAIDGVAILFMLGSLPNMANVQLWLDRQLSLLMELRQR